MKDSKKKKVNEGFGDSRINLPNDLSMKKGSAAYIIKQNLDRVNTCKTKDEIVALMHELFDEAGLSTPWTTKFFIVLQGKRDYASAIKYVYDAMLKGQGLGVLREKDVEKLDEGQFKSFNDFDLSKIPGSATQILTANFERFNACKTFEDVVALCHELFDESGLDTAWTAKFFRSLDQIKQNNLNPRRAYEQAMIFMNNARMRGMGLGMGRGKGRFYEDEELDESMDANEKEDFKKKLRDGKVEFKYKKKDGSERKAVGTMDPKLMDLPEKKSQSDVDGAEKKKVRKLPEDSVFYYDLDAKGFRSFKMENFIGYV